MSDAYEVTPDSRMQLKESRGGLPPNIKLDGAYKFVDQLNKMIPHGAPSLIGCTKLTVEGKVWFDRKVVIEGEVKVISTASRPAKLKAGTYKDQTVTLTH